MVYLVVGNLILILLLPVVELLAFRAGVADFVAAADRAPSGRQERPRIGNAQPERGVAN
jgi:hypothetical protein